MGRFWAYVLGSRRKRKFYVGQTGNIKRRVSQHRSGRGAKFPKRHGLHRVILKERVNSRTEAKRRERQLTKAYMRKYGKENVVGAGYTSHTTHQGQRRRPSRTRKRRPRRYRRRRR